MTSNKAFVPLWEVSRIEPINDPVDDPRAFAGRACVAAFNPGPASVRHG